MKRCLSTEEVLRRWRLPRADTEARCRRLKWLQACASHPQQHRQLIAAWFGTLRVDTGLAS